jgi:hypothetical protein
MKIVKADSKDSLVDIQEIELAYYGLTELSGTEKKLEDLKSLLELKWKGEPTLKIEEINSISFIQSERAFKMIIEALYDKYQNNCDMRFRFE